MIEKKLKIVFCFFCKILFAASRKIKKKHTNTNTNTNTQKQTHTNTNTKNKNTNTDGWGAMDGNWKKKQ